jgi:hypothetical protein
MDALANQEGFMPTNDTRAAVSGLKVTDDTVAPKLPSTNSVPKILFNGENLVGDTNSLARPELPATNIDKTIEEYTREASWRQTFPKFEERQSATAPTEPAQSDSSSASWGSRLGSAAQAVFGVPGKLWRSLGF